MDSLITASARALAAGDALGALKRVALRDDPPALALRGIAMAQLGELARARELLRRAARAFGSHEELARARCVVAEAEVALALRDVGGSPRTLATAAATLDAHDDRANALQARLIAVRRMLLLGRLDEARALLSPLDLRGLPPSPAAVASLALAELALRSLRIAEARAALEQAREAARRGFDARHGLHQRAKTADLHAQSRAVGFVGALRSEGESDQRIALDVARPGLRQCEREREEDRPACEWLPVDARSDAAAAGVDQQRVRSQQRCDLIEPQQLFAMRAHSAGGGSIERHARLSHFGLSLIHI